jgi:hypothetical protein
LAWPAVAGEVLRRAICAGCCARSMMTGGVTSAARRLGRSVDGCRAVPTCQSQRRATRFGWVDVLWANSVSGRYSAPEEDV